MNQQLKYSFKSPSIQKAMNLFAFLLAFPGIDLLFNSLYFYVFLWIIYKTHKITGKAILTSRFASILLVSWVFGMISTVFHPPLMSGTFNNLNIAIMVIRYAYWFAIGAYFYSWLPMLNIQKLAKWITLGFLLQVVGFYMFSFKVDLVVFSFNSGLTRNAFVFNSIIFSGFVFYYFYYRFGRKSFIAVALFLLFTLLLTNGRSGGVIVFILILLNSSIVYSGLRQISKIGIVLLIPIVVFSSNFEDTFSNYSNKIAPYFDGFSPRFANLLRGEAEGDLDFDKSWLIRELMVDKTIEIIRDYPLLGIGYGNFKSYSADLKSLNQLDYARLRGRHTNEYYNTRSGHNSYADYIASTGLIGFGLLLMLILPVLLKFVNNYWNGDLYKLGLVVFIITGLLGALLHGYAISAFTGANFWFVLGLSSAILRNQQKHFSLKNKF